MSLTLAIETSSPTYGVTVSAPDGLLARCTVQRADPAFHSIGHLVATCVQQAGVGFGQLDRIAVDCGPGQLSSVRAGVAYANGLAYSLSKPVFGANSLDILAFQASAEAPGRPVLCLRRSYADTVHAGLFTAGREPVLRHGPWAATVRDLVGDNAELAVAGVRRAEVVALLTDVRVADTGVELPDVLFLDRLIAYRGADAVGEPFATPITESTSTVCT